MESANLQQAPARILVQSLQKSYDDFLVINDLTFDVEAGSSLSIIGPSGCGKSTLLYLLAGLDSANKGKVVFANDNNKLGDIPNSSNTLHSNGNIHIADKSFFTLHRRNPRISYVMQDYGLFPWKNAEENLSLPLILNKISKNEQKKRISEMLVELGLEGINKKYPSELSGGQRQRLALGRALINSPEILLLDEPFSSVDAITREHLQKLVYQLWQKYHFTFVLVTHSVSEAIFLGQEVMVLEKISNNRVNKPLILKNDCFGLEDTHSSAKYLDIYKQLQSALAEVHK